MSHPLQPGQIFAGRYRIERFLAKGGFGAVYVAEQLETELRVALKVLWAHVLHSKDAVEKFKLEARVAGRVGSEHIVRVFDAGFDADSQMPFLVMELLEGEDLEKVVATRGPLPAETVVAYFRQITSALDKAHGYVDRDGTRRPIVHRDLKPENLFLAHRETGDPMVKVLDFGIAKVLGESTNVSQEVKGTPLYMAFEQATAGRVTPQTDIWALGLIGFYLLTGRCYWKTANAAEASLTQLFGEVLSMPLDPPSQRASEISATVVLPAGFDAWFARCVNREPSQRFATAGECAIGLATVLLGAPDTRLSPGAFQADAFAATSHAPSAPALSAPARSDGRAPRTEPAAGVSNTGASLGLGGTKAPPQKSTGSVLLGLGVAAAVVVGGALTIASLGGGSGATPEPSATTGAGATGSPQQLTTATSSPVLSATPSASAPTPASSAPVASTTVPGVSGPPKPGRPKPEPPVAKPPEPPEKGVKTPPAASTNTDDLYGER